MVDTFELALLWAVTAAAFLLVPMRAALAKKQGKPLPLGWTLQGLIFPVLLLVSLVLYLAGVADVILPAVAVGLLEELILGAVRRRRSK
mgnify:CR=1 FL=1